MVAQSDAEAARCPWCGDDPLYVAYHDGEWGVPEYDGRELFEKLILDGFQAGLSWITILRKREAFRRAFCEFDPYKIAEFDEADVERLVKDAGIIRHRGKIQATINGARIWVEMGGAKPFSDYLWSFTGGKPIQNQFSRMEDVPAQTPLSVEISKDLKKKGFRFCGPVIVYAFMQAMGMVNDHLTGCPRHEEVKTAKKIRA